MDQAGRGPEMLSLIVIGGVALAIGLYLLLHKVMTAHLGSRTDRQLLVGMEVIVFSLLVTGFVIDELFEISARLRSGTNGHPLVTVKSALFLFGTFVVSVLLYGAWRQWLKRIR